MNGWCDSCGIPLDDPDHDGWHKLLTWNQAIFDRAAIDRAAAFDTALEVHDARFGRRPSEPQGTLAGTGSSTNRFRANA